MTAACSMNKGKGVIKMKKFLALLVMMLLLVSTALAGETAPASVQVYVTITDDTGALVMAYEAITVTDADADGALTINDALIAAHTVGHENGAEAYSAVVSEYGLSMAKLWGLENGGSYGYYLNNASAWSLVDPVSEGDHVKAYAFTDLVGWADTYCYFDVNTVSATAGADVTLTLSAAGYDAAWNPVTLPVAGAVVTVNGEKTAFVTDENGIATLDFAKAGEYVISAVSDTQVLVAPVCIVTVPAEQ